MTTENMLIGLLRLSNGVFAEFFMGTGTDMPKLRARIGDRLHPDSDPLIGQDLPVDAVGQAAVRAAAAEADSRLRDSVGPLHVLKGILSQNTGPGARLLADVATTGEGLLERLKAAL